MASMFKFTNINRDAPSQTCELAGLQNGGHVLFVRSIQVQLTDTHLELHWRKPV